MSSPSEPSYVYRPRRASDMSARSFRFGEGGISGALSTLLGALSVLAVLCYRFPSYLTTRELREVYDPELLRLVLMVAMWAALGFGVLAFVLRRHARWGAAGCLLTLLAFALGGYRVEAGPVPARPVALGVDWLVLDLLLTAAAFIFVEKVVPKYPEQAILRPQWRLDLLYFCLNHLLIGFFLLAANAFAPAAFAWAVHRELQAGVRALPIVLQVLLLLACADLVQYWVHRAFHEVPALWRFHAVHHSTEHMDWLAGSRQHFLDVLVTRSIATVPLYLLGADKLALDGYVIFASLQAVFIHANVGIAFGPLKYLLVTPQYHHWHHGSERPAIDTNYAVHLPLWDRLFGTLHLPGEHWPAEYGTVERLPRTFLSQLVYPFARAGGARPGA